MASRRIAVIGGGLAGLTAAYDLAAAGADVVVLEGSDQIGGKLRVGEVGGVSVDLGAEAILARRPEALDLMAELGLSTVHPNTSSAAIWTRGALRPMPRTVMGIPADRDALASSGIVESLESHVIAAPEADQSVGDFVAARLGREVVDRLVEPLLGGVYAGHADRLSLRAAAPQIAALGADLLAGAAAVVPADGPVFAGLVGGVGQLPSYLVDAGGLDVRLHATVRGIEHTPAGWMLMVGPTTAIERLEVDAVVVATPAPATARLLAEIAPGAAFALAAIDYASVALGTFVLTGAELPDGSGFLVPPVDGTAIKGATFSSSKWEWTAAAAGDQTVVRASVGRAGETTMLHQPDEVVLAAIEADLRRAVPGLGRVEASHLQRWGGALPQYDVGHLDRVADIESAIAEVPGIELCGAAYRGVGIPAVIASARAAAARLVAAGTMNA